MKKTAKAVKAFEALQEIGIATAKMSREDVYFQLGKLGYEWDSDAQVWYKPEVSKSDIKRLRLVVEKPDLDAESDFVIKALESYGCKVLDCAKYTESRNPKYKNSTQARAYIQYTR